MTVHYVKTFGAIAALAFVAACSGTKGLTQLATLQDETAPAGPDTLTTVPPDTLRRGELVPIERFTDRADSISYAMGISIGQALESQGIELKNIAAFATGVQDMILGTDSTALRLPETVVESILRQVQQDAMARQQEKTRLLREANLAEAAEFLQNNASQEGVRTTESGLQYRVIREGEGIAPTPASTVVVHYSGRLLDGTEFDSSRRRGQPATFGVQGVIRGWTEGLQLMKPGAVYEFFIPPDLGYGVQGNQRIPPNALLIFEVELIEVR